MLPRVFDGLDEGGRLLSFAPILYSFYVGILLKDLPRRCTRSIHSTPFPDRRELDASLDLDDHQKGE